MGSFCPYERKKAMGASYERRHILASIQFQVCYLANYRSNLKRRDFRHEVRGGRFQNMHESSI